MEWQGHTSEGGQGKQQLQRLLIMRIDALFLPTVGTRTHTASAGAPI